MRGKPTDFFWKGKGPIVVSGSGPFKPGYLELAIKRENYPFSSLQQETLPQHVDWRSTGHRQWGGTVYIETLPMSKRDADREAKKIRTLGGLARVTKIWGGRYTVWFNPNGSPAALQYVAGW